MPRTRRTRTDAAARAALGDERDETRWVRCDPLAVVHGTRCATTLPAVLRAGVCRVLIGGSEVWDRARRQQGLCEYHYKKLVQFATGALTDQNNTPNYQILKFAYHFYYTPELQRCSKYYWRRVIREDFGLHQDAHIARAIGVVANLEWEVKENLNPNTWSPSSAREEQGN